MKPKNTDSPRYLGQKQAAIRAAIMRAPGR